MHTEGSNVPSLSGKHTTGCGDYTQMWELRHAGHRVHGMDPVIESPYGTHTCCNNKPPAGSGGGSSFTTFKPREPIYMTSRRPINVTSILRPNMDGVPFYLDVDPNRPSGGTIGGNNNQQNANNEQDASNPNNSPTKRPDLLSSNRSGVNGDINAQQRRNPGQEEAIYSAANRDLCGHCAVHQSNENILAENNPPVPPPIVVSPSQAQCPNMSPVSPISPDPTV